MIKIKIKIMLIQIGSMNKANILLYPNNNPILKCKYCSLIDKINITHDKYLKINFNNIWDNIFIINHKHPFCTN